jgi:hypothetical protein
MARLNDGGVDRLGFAPVLESTTGHIRGHRYSAVAPEIGIDSFNRSIKRLRSVSWRSGLLTLDIE